MTSVQGCKVDRSAGRSHLASGEPAGTATGERAAGRPNPASLVTPSTLVQYSGGNDLHEKTTPETVGVRRPFGTARIGGPDEQESRRTEEPDTENGRYRQMLWIRLHDHAATFSSVPSTNFPFLNLAPALTSATR